MSIDGTSQVDPTVVDVHLLKLDAEGSQPFSWPLGRDELLAMRDHLTVNLIRLVQSALTAKVSGSVPTALLSHVYIMECMALYQARALVRRYRELESPVSWPAESRLWRALDGGNLPTPPTFVNRLDAGPARRHPLLEKIAPLGRKLRGGRLVAHLRFPYRRPRHGIVTTRFDNQILLAHARMVDGPVSHVHVSSFFEAGHQREHIIRQFDRGLLEELIQLIGRSFEAGSEELTSLDSTYLREVIERSAASVARWMQGLERQADTLPRQLWTGTAGNLWDRMLRWVVRQEGGHTTGHDHATGHGHLHHPLNYLVEFVACDKFVTDHPAKVTAARAQALPEMLPEGKLPEIVSLPAKQAYGIERLSSSQRSESEPKRKVMYVAALYPGENLHLLPYPPDLAMVDWQARLFSKIRSWGYDIVHQAHPEGTTRPPTRLARCSGVTPTVGRFEENFSVSNTLIFDYFLQTTLGRALRTAVPIVLIDFDHVEILPAARVDLARRCAIVKAQTGPDNRFYLDWNELQAALEKAPSLAENTDFLRGYLQQELSYDDNGARETVKVIRNI